jgi:dihydrofolate synthase / folylpolyglutamate synthase
MSPGLPLAQLLDDFKRLHPREIDLSLGRTQALLAKLGNPQDRLPPVFHVAGTNGKGSTVAFLRACLEAAGHRVHVYTSPHLVNFRERIRLAGALISDADLTDLLRDVARINGEEPITFFEIVTAAALLAFSRTPADACILEVGLGGRLDATNVVRAPASCGIAQLGLDHQQFLGETILEIAGEKAGIAKAGVPLVLSRYSRPVTGRISEIAGVTGAKLVLRGGDWEAASYEEQFHYRDAHGRLEATLPRLAGVHQLENAGLAFAMLRHQSAVAVPDSAFRAGLGWAEWPARLQRLAAGPLATQLPPGSELWLDGGHNPLAGRALGDWLKAQAGAPMPTHLVVGMMARKDVDGFLRPMASSAASLIAVPVPGEDHEGHPAEAIAALASGIGLRAQTAANVETAIKLIRLQAPPGTACRVLICGSLYLAGEVLAISGLEPS